jgi:hypothetical protein
MSSGTMLAANAASSTNPSKQCKYAAKKISDKAEATSLMVHVL